MTVGTTFKNTEVLRISHNGDKNYGKPKLAFLQQTRTRTLQAAGTSPRRAIVEIATPTVWKAACPAVRRSLTFFCSIWCCPSSTGLRSERRLAETGAKCRTIVLSGFVNNKGHQRLHQLRRRYFMPKPCDVPALLTRIRQLAGHENYSYARRGNRLATESSVAARDDARSFSGRHGYNP